MSSKIVQLEHENEYLKGIDKILDSIKNEKLPIPSLPGEKELIY